MPAADAGRAPSRAIRKRGAVPADGAATGPMLQAREPGPGPLLPCCVCTRGTWLMLLGIHSLTLRLQMPLRTASPYPACPSTDKGKIWSSTRLLRVHRCPARSGRASNDPTPDTRLSATPSCIKELFLSDENSCTNLRANVANRNCGQQSLPFGMAAGGGRLCLGFVIAKYEIRWIWPSVRCVQRERHMSL